ALGVGIWSGWQWRTGGSDTRRSLTEARAGNAERGGCAAASLSRESVPTARSPQPSLEVTLEILAGIVRHPAGREHRHHATGRNVDPDRVRGLVAGEQPGGDERRRATGNHRGELIPQGCPTVANATLERFRDGGRLRPVQHGGRHGG